MGSELERSSCYLLYAIETSRGFVFRSILRAHEALLMVCCGFILGCPRGKGFCWLPRASEGLANCKLKPSFALKELRTNSNQNIMSRSARQGRFSSVDRASVSLRRDILPAKMFMPRLDRLLVADISPSFSSTSRHSRRRRSSALAI